MIIKYLYSFPSISRSGLELNIDSLKGSQMHPNAKRLSENSGCKAFLAQKLIIFKYLSKGSSWVKRLGLLIGRKLLT